MNSRSPQDVIFPDEETLQAWKNMRIEILHELQEGAIKDVPDSYIDDLGTLVVVLASWRAQKKLCLPEAFNLPNNKWAKSVN